MNSKTTLKEKNANNYLTHTSQEKGITLVALIITIIVLLILAVVAIRAVSNDGIISHAKNAQTRYEQEQAKEQAMLESYLDKIVEIPIEETQKDTMLSKETNSVTFDKYGNKIVVPAGFKILVDSTTDYMVDTIDVTKGIVIQDENGNEFVWIPVGEINYEEDDTIKTTTITLGRYTGFTKGAYVIIQPTATNPYTSEVAITRGSYYNLKELQATANGKGPNGNAIAKDIKDFYEKAIKSHGYYIGRFEAGKENNKLVCKADQNVYVNITQLDASDKCQSMYTNKPYESDLINSYAWDTAIVFIQTFGTEEGASSYASANKSNGFKQTGANQKNGVPDKYRNIYDMSGNAEEWSTETASTASIPCSLRGGAYYISEHGAYNVTSSRMGRCSTTDSDSDTSFRPLLYV